MTVRERADRAAAAVVADEMKEEREASAAVEEEEARERLQIHAHTSSKRRLSASHQDAIARV